MPMSHKIIIGWFVLCALFLLCGGAFRGHSK